MADIWRWDKTMSSIRAVNEWPKGYVDNMDRMTILSHDGRTCVRFHEPDETPQGGFDSCNITLVIPQSYWREWWAQYYVWVPAYFSSSWWNISSMYQEYGGGEYFSDPLRFGSGLRSIVVGPEPDEHYYKSDYYMPKAQWNKVRFHTVRGNGDGMYQVWFNDELVHDIRGLDNRKDVAGEHGVRCRLIATYASGEAVRPFDVYFADMILASLQSDLNGAPPPPAQYNAGSDPAGIPFSILKK